MNNFKISARDCQEDDSIGIVDVDGCLDVDSSPQFTEQINSLISQGKYNLLLNFTKINYINTSGIRAMMSPTIKARKKGGDVRLACLPDDVYGIMKMLLDFTMVFRIFKTEEEGIASFRSEKKNCC